MTKKTTPESQPRERTMLEIALRGGCECAQSRDCPQLTAALFAQGIVLTVPDAFPSRSNPIFCPPPAICCSTWVHWFRSTLRHRVFSAGDFASLMVMPKYTGRPELGHFIRVTSPCKPEPWKAVLFPLRLLSSIFMKYEVNYSICCQTVSRVFFSWK